MRNGTVTNTAAIEDESSVLRNGKDIIDSTQNNDSSVIVNGLNANVPRADRAEEMNVSNSHLSLVV